jgi:hypothetical protein
LAIAAMMPAALATAQAADGLYVPLFTYRTGPFAGSGTPYEIQGAVVSVDRPDHFNYILREPVGVCAFITPWNSRLTHHVHILEMNGESYRLAQSKRRSRRANSSPKCWHRPNTCRNGSITMPDSPISLPRAFTNVAELVSAPEVDIVSVTVKVPHHLEIVRAALNAGKHVYCEWPLGNGLAEAEELKQFPAYLNRWDSQQARNEGVFALVQLSVKGARGDEKAFQSLAVPASYRTGWPENVVPGNVARVYARMAQDLREGTRTAPRFEDAVAVHRIISAIERGAEHGRRTSV